MNTLLFKTIKILLTVFVMLYVNDALGQDRYGLNDYAYEDSDYRGGSELSGLFFIFAIVGGFFYFIIAKAFSDSLKDKHESLATLVFLIAIFTTPVAAAFIAIFATSYFVELFWVAVTAGVIWYLSSINKNQK